MTKPRLPPGARIRPDGRYEQRLTLDGKRISIYAGDAKELREKVDAAERRHARGVYLRANETVASYLTRWLADAIIPHRAANTARLHAVNIRLHIVPAIGDIRLDRLAVADVRALLNGLLADHRPGTVNTVRTTLVAALNEAMNEELVPRNVAARVPKMRDAPARRAPLTRAEVARLLAATTGDRLEALFVLLLACGPRIGEALGLTWDRLDLARGEMRIDRQLTRDEAGFALTAPKTRSSVRVVALPAMARRALVAHRARQDAERGDAGAWGNPWGLVFTRPGGYPLFANKVRERLGRYCAEAGLPPVAPHDLRHSCASLLAEQGVPEIEVAALLGHAGSDTTRAVYLHAYESGRGRVAGVMDALFEDGSG